MNSHAFKIPLRLLGQFKGAKARAASAAVLVWAMATLSVGAAETPIVVSGITESFLEVSLSSSVAGLIGNQAYKEGDFVTNGAPVVELDRKLEELEVERRKLIVDVRKSDFEGTQKLFTKTKGTSKEELEKKETEYRVAVVEYETAVEQLRKRYVLAPFAGHITQVLLHPGEACQPYQPVVRMVDTRQCFFVSNMEAKLAATLKTNQTLRLEIETGATPVKVDGKISFLSPIADPASGLVKVKVIFPNANGQIRPGLAGSLILTQPATGGAAQ
jgi:RND family efflux transporter MFP subunit